MSLMTNKTFKDGWYVIYTRPNHERRVHARLHELNITSFLPLRKKIRNHPAGRKAVEEPLFPSYLFIYLNDLRSYYSGADTDGALYYVRSGREMARVSELEINNIKLAVKQGCQVEISDDRFKPGRHLIITKGALTGLACEVVEYGGKEKLLVRIDLLRRNLLLSFPQEHLMAI